MAPPEGADLGAQSAARAPDGLVLTVSFLAPALCWRARTTVLSIIAYSLSASAARCWNIRSQTPLLAQRLNRVLAAKGARRCDLWRKSQKRHPCHAMVNPTLIYRYHEGLNVADICANYQFAIAGLGQGTGG